MAMVVVPKHEVLVTAGLDRKICLWDLNKHRFKFVACRISHDVTDTTNCRGYLTGMKTGVRHLIYATEQDIIFASGFDNDALGWDANTNGLLLRYAR